MRICVVKILSHKLIYNCNFSKMIGPTAKNVTYKIKNSTVMRFLAVEVVTINSLFLSWEKINFEFGIIRFKCGSSRDT